MSFGICFCCSMTCGRVENESISRSTTLNVTTTRKTTLPKKHKGKSILSEDGDVIDCVDIYKQPAFNHPALRNHTIQMAPTNVLKSEKTMMKKPSIDTKKEHTAMTTTSQLWHKSGSCPKGTIPIRRIQKHLLKDNNIHTYGRKKPNHEPKNQESTLKDNINSLANHSVAEILAEGYSYSGAKADIKVWSPYVEKDDEYSTSRIAVINGGLYDFEIVETGWAVNPSVYNDHETRLYVYWTADGSKTTGCFDLTCPGFVQVDHRIALGAAIYPVSKPKLPYQIIVYIYKDPMTNNWWVNYGESINIGYWPGELFVLLKHQGLMVKWGGEVYSTRVKTHPHTATYMGNGEMPPAMFDECGTMTRMRVEQNSQPLMIPEWTIVALDEYRCYDILYEVDYVYDPVFFYGGPGRSWRCP